MSVSWRRTVRKAVHVRNDYIRCFLSEFFGSMVLVFMIDAMGAHAIFNTRVPGKPDRLPTDQVHLALGAATAVMLGVLVSGGSGAHLNPAVSGAFWSMGRISWKKMLIYFVAQYSGALVASAGIYVVYRDALDVFDGGIRQVSGPNGTAGIFATYPAKHITSWPMAFFDQIIATSVLMFGVLAIVDEKNWGIAKGLVPLYVGLLIMSIVLSLGYNTGAAMNPARDLMPRLFTYLAGWGEETFSVMGYTWFWIPIVGSHIGAVIGAILYQTLMGAHWPDDEPKSLAKSSLDDLDMQYVRTPTKSPTIFKVPPNGFSSPAQESTDLTRALLVSTPTSVA